MISHWNNVTAVVTGALGFIGSRLAVDLSSRGAKVVSIDRDVDTKGDSLRENLVARSKVISGDLRDFEFLNRTIAESQPSFVFHLGAQTVVGNAHQMPHDTFESNIRGTYNLLEACRRNPESISGVIVASSDKAYGESDGLPLGEDSPLRGRGPYDVSKSCTDLLAQSYLSHYQVPVIVLRCSNVYGGGDLNWSRIVSGTIRSLSRRQPPVIRSDGRLIREYTYVSDVVAAYRTAAEKSDFPNLSGNAFNISTEERVSVLDLVRSIQSVMNAGDLEPIIQGQAKDEITDQRLSASKARAVLGWTPTYKLETGLRETIPWYLAYLARTGELP